jgi:hypothetical protein
MCQKFDVMGNLKKFNILGATKQALTLTTRFTRTNS